jgi:hypothetical protein
VSGARLVADPQKGVRIEALLERTEVSHAFQQFLCLALRKSEDTMQSPTSVTDYVGAVYLPMPSFDVEAIFDTVTECGTVLKYSADQTVFSQGDQADAVFFIRAGRVKATVTSQQGKEAVVAIHGSGGFFGERCLTGQPQCLATMAAMTDGRLEK